MKEISGEISGDLKQICGRFEVDLFKTDLSADNRECRCPEPVTSRHLPYRASFRPYVADNPTDPASMSPYSTSLVKLVERYGITDRRLQILSGLLTFRQELGRIGIENGFQWLDGSFVEDIERTEKRSPGDIDVVTFFRRPAAMKSDEEAMHHLVYSNRRLFLPSETRARFSCDAYFVDLDTNPESIVGQTRYWFGLFSHKRTTQLWKGLLAIQLGTVQDDSSAVSVLQARTSP